MFEIKNKISYKELRKKSWNWGNTLIAGIPLSRFCASWLHSGGKWNDGSGFKLWMMNIPIQNEDGTITYISQDDAEDAYELMSCGKMELEGSAARFIGSYEKNEKGYLKIPLEDLLEEP